MKQKIIILPIILVMALIVSFALLLYFKPPAISLNSQNLLLANFIINAIVLTMVSVMGTIVMLKMK